MKAVLFDLDGTLLDRDRSLKQFVEVQYDRLADDLGHVQKASYVARFIELDCRGQVWKDKVYQTLVEEFDLSGVTWQVLLEDYITEFQRHCIPFRGMAVMLNELKQRNYLLAVVTNGRSEFQRRSISGLGIQNDLDVVLVSEEEQIRKPQSRDISKSRQPTGRASFRERFCRRQPRGGHHGRKERWDEDDLETQPLRVSGSRSGCGY